MEIVINVVQYCGNGSWEDGPGSLFNVGDTWEERDKVWLGEVPDDMDISESSLKEFLKTQGIHISQYEGVEAEVV